MAQEREHVRSTDVFLAADCPMATAAALRKAVEQNRSHIRAAYLMRKQTAEGDGRPLYVLGIERRHFPYENTGLANRLLLQRIMHVPGVPGDVLVCVVTRASRAMLARWKSVPASPLYPERQAADRRSPAVAKRPGAKTPELVREPAATTTLPPRSSPAAAE